MKTTLKQLLIAIATLSLVFAIACKDEKKKDDDEKKEKTEQGEGSSGPSEGELEVVKYLDRAVKGAAVYYLAPRVSNEGIKLPCQYPTTNEWTPSGDPCATGGKHPYDIDQWSDDESWLMLNFIITDDHYGQYRMESSGTLKDATVTFFGRFKNCETGKWTTFSRTMTGDPNGTIAECDAQPPGPVQEVK